MGKRDIGEGQSVGARDILMSLELEVLTCERGTYLVPKFELM